MVAAAKAVLAGEANAGERLAKAVNCASCHVKYRPVRGQDGTILAEPGVFATALPPEFVMLAGVSKDKATISIYRSVEKRVLKYKEVEVEQDGKRRTQKIPYEESVREISQASLTVASYRLVNSQGNDITGDGAWKKLVPGTILFLAQSAQPIDKAYSRALADEAVVLVPKDSQ
jgi:hypothetical protein